MVRDDRRYRTGRRRKPSPSPKAGTFDYTSKSEPWLHWQIIVEEAPARLLRRLRPAKP